MCGCASVPKVALTGAGPRSPRPTSVFSQIPHVTTLEVGLLAVPCWVPGTVCVLGGHFSLRPVLHVPALSPACRGPEACDLGPPARRRAQLPAHVARPLVPHNWVALGPQDLAGVSRAFLEEGAVPALGRGPPARFLGSPPRAQNASLSASASSPSRSLPLTLTPGGTVPRAWAVCPGNHLRAGRSPIPTPWRGLGPRPGPQPGRRLATSAPAGRVAFPWDSPSLSG